jgi:ankyrin repeat protein
MMMVVVLTMTACSSSMMELAKRGDLAGVEGKIAAGKDVNARSPRGTALVQAARAGRIEVVRALVAAGADLEAMAWTTGARHAATGRSPRYQRHVPVNVDSSGPQSSFMIRPNAEVVWVRREGKTALMLASQKGRLEVVRLLLNAGAKVHARSAREAGNGGKPENLDYYGHQEGYSPAESGKTALTYAVENGHTKIAEVLTEAGGVE